jgi:23S rRNA-/tRNA-specific pseudouridylate synthase
VGDEVYGKKKQSILMERHFLHARSLKILLPGETKPSFFEAPLPGELESVLASLRNE